MQTLFWYIYASDGEQGFLLDLIDRSAAAEARLLCCSLNHLPLVFREVVPREQLRAEQGHLAVRLGDLKLDCLGCSGAQGEIRLDAEIQPSGKSITFVPRWVTRSVNRVPYFSSHYGWLTRGECRGVAYRRVPLVYSTYEVGDLAKAEWILISATRFEDTDLMFEISASYLVGSWAVSAYIFFEGREYKLNTPWDSVSKMRVFHAGDVSDGKRVFTASIHCSEISLQIEAAAPAERFALLAHEGETYIHTTLLGDCRASIYKGASASGNETYHSSRRCLLEVKR